MYRNIWLLVSIAQRKEIEQMQLESDHAQLRLAQTALSWSGWGSPIGAGFFLVALSVCAVLLRHAWLLH